MGIKERIEAEKDRLLLVAKEELMKATLSLHSKIQAKSPVDTGELRRSWTITEVNPFEFTIHTDKPYAKPLEYGLYPNPPQGGKGKTIDGFSTQAPKGFVRISMEEVFNEFE